MRKIVIIRTVILLYCFVGCGGDNKPDEPASAVRNLIVGHPEIINCVGTDICGYYIRAEFDENESGYHLYRMYLKHSSGKPDYYSPALKIGSGSGSYRFGTFHIPYYSGLSAGEYTVEVDKVPDANSLRRSRLTSVAATATVTLSAFGSSCYSSCCTRDQGDSDGTGSRRWCLAAEDVGNVQELRSEIKTRWGELCSNGLSTERARSYAFIDLQDDLAGNQTAFLQVGYGRLRSQGDWTINSFLYMEMKHPSWSNTRQRVFEGDAVVPLPVDGEYHEYKLVINRELSRWEFYYDQTELIASIEFPSWPDSLNRWVICETEISKRETDMPGTASDPCVFRNCRYQVSGGNWIPFDFRSADILGCTDVAGRPKEWEIRAGDSLERYDRISTCTALVRQLFAVIKVKEKMMLRFYVREFSTPLAALAILIALADTQSLGSEGQTRVLNTAQEAERAARVIIGTKSDLLARAIDSLRASGKQPMSDSLSSVYLPPSSNYHSTWTVSFDSVDFEFADHGTDTHTMADIVLVLDAITGFPIRVTYKKRDAITDHESRTILDTGLIVRAMNEYVKAPIVAPNVSFTGALNAKTIVSPMNAGLVTALYGRFFCNEIDGEHAWILHYQSLSSPVLRGPGDEWWLTIDAKTGKRVIWHSNGPCEDGEYVRPTELK